MPSGGNRLRSYLGVALAVVAIDFWTKVVIEGAFDRSRVVSVLSDVVQLRLVYNPGAAFGLHLGPFSRWIFLGIALAALVLLTRMALTTPPSDRFRLLTLGLVAGGAAGNLIDRVRSTLGVVDFIDVGIGLTRWPTFNVADIGVTCGAIGLAISLWREDARVAKTSPESS